MLLRGWSGESGGCCCCCWSCWLCCRFSRAGTKLAEGRVLRLLFFPDDISLVFIR